MTLTSMQKGRIDNVLSRAIRHKGVIKTRKQFVEDLVIEGLTTSTYEENRIKDMSRRAFNRATGEEQWAHERRQREAGKVTRYCIGNYVVTKIEYDYARELIAAKEHHQEKLARSMFSGLED